MKIPQGGTLKLIDDSISARAESSDKRTYMGASGLGEECDRKLWYSFHHPKPLSNPRVQRIMDVGHKLEGLVIDWLKGAGLNVYTETENGEQYSFSDEMIAGHIDGVISGLVESDRPHLLEIKTANDKRFSEFEKNGVKATESKYFTQVQVYMKYFELDRCFFIVVNKNDCALYVERIEFDPIEAEWAINRGKEIANAAEAKRKYKDKNFFKCKFCDYREECWKE